MRDNVWLTQVARADYPVRVVGYDSNDLIIGIEDFGVEHPHAKPVGKWRTILAVQGLHGVARLRVARSTEGGRCYEILLPRGAGSSGCSPRTRPPQVPKLNLSITNGPTGAWLTGDVANNITSLDIVLANGKTKTVTTEEGYIIAPVPPGSGAVVEIIGRDSNGTEIGRRRPQ